MSALAFSYSEACKDPDLFGPWFAADTWSAWHVIDKALFGEPLDQAELAIFTELTGRDEAPTSPATEGWFICGRRSGKDVKAASIVAYLATFGAEQYGYLSKLVRGERGVVQALAVDRDQAKVVLGYTKAFFEQPILRKTVKRETADGIELKNGLSIEVTTNDKRRVRGRTVVAAVLDEVAFWLSENSSNPDEDVFQAIKPSMATIPGAMLIGISSPHARKGLLYRKWKTHWGKNSKVLVVRAPTWRMNPNLTRDSELIAEAYADDASSAAAEFGAEFRVDVEQFVSLDVVEACVPPGVVELPYEAKNSYVAFADSSGGSNDSYTLAIAHRDGKRAILDAVRERKPPFSPEAVTAEYAGLLKSYGITTVHGDKYAGEFPRELYRNHGIHYRVAEKTRSELYQAMLPGLNSGSIELLDNKKLVTQIVGLERRVARGGRESIDHGPNGHDDIANAVAGAMNLILQRREPPVAYSVAYHRQ
ncbi:hypothetical protein [Mesorhizobium sp. M8A.F.Ca.ET.165.01.1.1]|uniref:hypothetical protein n=1 Tax=Mesorhizobium sp. M8A.F.Ca.ET.165.01.1.1 TaxID=2563960 RepID=UPI001093EC46|nr:hypothetical protein [Mesorhizobium sp. M8A.F.Ca.ET.165.01.1.1]TGT42623.1 hypothetical protein EN808_12065 [Mesorhizobium sp. M8A.F.Ca.ET.165.01.1.1]